MGLAALGPTNSLIGNDEVELGKAGDILADGSKNVVRLSIYFFANRAFTLLS